MRYSLADINKWGGFFFHANRLKCWNECFDQQMKSIHGTVTGVYLWANEPRMRIQGHFMLALRGFVCAYARCIPAPVEGSMLAGKCNHP
ncbi:hypothetical protein [Paenibacillus alvei]|uniref:hypothetical protein n=2 Tax=Paenibacillus alvei TaxID=44250 RepID=UPI0013DB24BC|nr:hypothetical protein [Paenibacillus alvei]MBG9733012.1 hypothetical protein [Paenibacillus alvei]MBG9744980.1 hypothetical protein [Paenibacillus alvei]MCY9581857.1 hypothetical protein [Paenibacillus alvei]